MKQVVGYPGALEFDASQPDGAPLKRLDAAPLRALGWRPRVDFADGLRENVWPLLESGAVKPVIHQVFPLEQAGAAHALMESSAHVGKIMLAVRP